MSHAIALDDVNKTFDQVRAIADVGLQVEAGQMFGLVGPDGAGKTTLLRLLAGILRQDSGSIRVLGQTLPEGRREVRQRIGYLSQGFALYGDLSVDENLSFFAEIYGMRSFEQRRGELLEFTRLEPFRDRLAGRLSGGMKKKLALACALIHHPELILLDEPTTGVDPVSRRDFWVILGALLKEGITIVVSTPYLDEAERCGVVGLLRAGRFLTIGPPQELKEQLDGALYEIVTEEPRRVRASLDRVPLSGVTEIQAQGDRIHLRFAAGESPDDDRSSDRIRDYLREAGLPFRSVRPTSPTLENLFVSLIRKEEPS